MRFFNKSYFLRIFQSLKSSSVAKFVITHKKALSIIIISLFIAFFAYYIVTNPSVLVSISKIGLLAGISILVFYFIVLLTNLAVMQVAIKLHDKSLTLKKGFLLSIYASVINFFGPLQSGPGVRAVYLKAKLKLRIRDYTYAMLVYYLAFGLLNLSLIFIAIAWWLTIIGVILSLVLTIIASRFFRSPKRLFYAISIFVITLIQVVMLVAIYNTELQSVSSSALTILQTASYTGSANLSLFVSLTPGGIGIREAFLVFSQSLHQVGLSSIVAAGVIDRALYVIFLGILFVISSSMHLRQLFTSKKLS